MASFSIDAILGNCEPKHEDSRLLDTQDLLYATREDESGRIGIYLNFKLQSHFIVHKESQ